jgi:SET domain-containing protein
MRAILYYLETSKEMGRGLYANQDIKAGTIITECEVLVLNPDDTKTVDNTDLKWYTFKYDDTRDCLVLGDGEIFNHADQPNVAYILRDHPDKTCPRKIMSFISVKDIKENDQLFIDYSADTNVKASEYTTNLI